MNATQKAVAAGAANFRGEHIVVWLTQGDVTWPHRCACCVGRPEKKGVVENGDGGIVAEFPICRLCHQHAQIDDRAMVIAMAIGAITVVGGWIALFGLSVMVYFGIQIALMFIAFVLVAFAAKSAISFFVGRKRRNCPDAGWPVTSLVQVDLTGMFGKDSERTDEKNLRLWCEEMTAQLGPEAYALQITNSVYARELIGANGGDAKAMHYIADAY